MKIALITGATGGIGQAIAERLAQHYHVILHTHRQPDLARELAQKISAKGGSAEVCQFDMRDAEQTRRTLEALLEKGPIQIVVHNAGIHQDTPFAGMPLEAWRSVIDLNLHGFYHVLHPLLLPMMATRWGRIISLSSIAAITGNRGQTNYSAAKSGLHGASRSLALELASRQITVNVVAPGIIDTAASLPDFDIQKIKTLVPMQRAGQPEEVAALVNFLASEEAAYISGQIISINGGMI